MEINEGLIRRFFSKECTPSEADFVAAYLRENPDAGKEYFGEDEFEANVPPDADSESSILEWDALQRKLRKQQVKKNITRLAVAACLIGVMVTAIRFVSRQDIGGPVAGNDTQVQKPYDGWTEMTNHTDTVKMVALADGSKIRLSAGASVRYNEQVWQTRRDIELDGEATFYVAKDKMRPFVVFCSRVSVRALGTIFSVRQQNGPDSMRVRLYEGKVLVRKLRLRAGKDTADAIKPVTLRPGEEIMFSEGKDLAFVRTFLKESPRPAVAANKKIIKSTRQHFPNTWIEFKDQPLSDLFTSLEVLYNVEINYNQKDVQGVFFIGRFEPYDTIDGILEIIAKLNGLAIEKIAPGKYHISR